MRGCFWSPQPVLLDVFALGERPCASLCLLRCSSRPYALAGSGHCSWVLLQPLQAAELGCVIEMHLPQTLQLQICSVVPQEGPSWFALFCPRFLLHSSLCTLRLAMRCGADTSRTADLAGCAWSGIDECTWQQMMSQGRPPNFHLYLQRQHEFADDVRF